MIKTRKAISFKMTAAVLAIVMLISVCTSIFYEVLAQDGNNTKLVIQTNNNVISIDTTDTNKLIYKIGDITVGTVKAKKDGNYLTPEIIGGKVEFVLPEYTNESYTVSVEVTASAGYERQPSYFYQGTSDNFPGDNILSLDISSNNVHTLDFCFETDNGGSGGNHGPVEPIHPTYPIVAYFQGHENGVTMDEEGIVLMPENWTNGKVSFKAKTCKVNGKIAPDDGFNLPDPDSQEEIAVRIEGIANFNQIDGTVTGSSNRDFVTISEEFNEYGKATIHITSVEEGGPVNTIINIITADLINIQATAPLDMSFSVGSAAVDQAIITKDVVKDLSIFFGNTETTLIVRGLNVDKITAVNSNVNNVILNNDGSATVKLPDLSVETSTPVQVTILLKDGTSIKRTVNIRRTAIILEFDDRENELRAGYVMNKAYLYNNKNHNDEIFNAYLQVIFYKDNVVAGYKQVKIDDEEIVNGLRDNEAWSIETFAENPIILYDGSVKGINKASVFLTNGPIDFDSDTLPSVEFGIGSGVTLEFGGEE